MVNGGQKRWWQWRWQLKEMAAVGGVSMFRVYGRPSVLAVCHTSCSEFCFIATVIWWLACLLLWSVWHTRYTRTCWCILNLYHTLKHAHCSLCSTAIYTAARWCLCGAIYTYVQYIYIHTKYTHTLSTWNIHMRCTVHWSTLLVFMGCTHWVGGQWRSSGWGDHLHTYHHHHHHDNHHRQ